MEIIENTALKLCPPPSAKADILNSISKSSEVGDEIVVYWGYNEAARLTYILDELRPAIQTPDVPSPILRDYKWPGIYSPFDHQRDTASYLSLRSRAFCFNEAGTGKTSAALWAADYLMDLGLVKRVLVVCPLSIMQTAWKDDIFKTTMHRSVGIAHGTTAKRNKIIAEGYDFTIINYDGVNVVRDSIAKAAYDLIIIDEANAYKTASTKRWKTLARLMTPNTRLWMMTGTPASQSPEDAFGLAKLVSPHRVPKFATAWKDRVMTQVTRFKWVPKSFAKNEVHKALQPAIRYTKAECTDLPEVVYQTREIALTPQVAVYYKRLKTQMLIEAAGEQISAVNAAASLNKLLQISGGAVYTDTHEVIEFDISPRLAALKEVLDETDHKVVIFVPYLHTIDVISDYLNKEGVSNAVIKGSVPARARAQFITQFQTQPDPHVLVIQPQSASHGVTLTAADTVVFWSPVLSVETYLQCIARIDRVGQKNSMTVVHLQGSDVEHKVYSMLRGKVDDHQQLVDLYKQVIGV